MFLFLFMLLIVAVATESNESSTPFDLESEMSTEMFAERTVGGSNSNDPSFNNGTESIVNGPEFVSAMSTGMPMEHEVKRFDIEWEEPYCDNSTERNVTVQLGNTANLCCRVPHLGDIPVIWVRPEEHDLLAIGELVIARDARIMSSQLENSDDWNLKIRSTTLKDAGVYMCQINTIPYKSFSIVLNIVVPKATIQEGSNLYVQSGRDINLTCVINGVISPFINVTWFKDELNMNHYSSSSMDYNEEKGINYAKHLRIFRAQSTNSGNYTCKPTNADPASISVHVFNGRIPETTTVEPVTTTVAPVEPVTTPVTVHHGQQPSSVSRFMPFPLLLLLLSILWIL